MADKKAPKKTTRTKKCTAAVREGRKAKARQFWDAAEILDTLVADQEDDLVDAYITLCVHAGIAAADVVCCARTGNHAQGQDHEEAIALLTSVDKTLAGDLETLLKMKTRSGYSDRRSPRSERARAKRAARRLVDASESA